MKKILTILILISINLYSLTKDKKDNEVKAVVGFLQLFRGYSF